MKTYFIESYRLTFNISRMRRMCVRYAFKDIYKECEECKRDRYCRSITDRKLPASELQQC